MPALDTVRAPRDAHLFFWTERGGFEERCRGDQFEHAGGRHTSRGEHLMAPSVTRTFCKGQDLAAACVEYDHAAPHRIGTSENLERCSLQLWVEREHGIATGRERRDPTSAALHHAIQVERWARLGRGGAGRG